MRNIRILVIAALFCVFTNNIFAIQPTVDNDKKVEELLSKMTLKEKVGQMSQIDLATFVLRVDPKGSFYGPQVEPHVLVPDSLQKYIVDYGIGSMFNIGRHGYTIDQWYVFMKQIQEYAVKKTRLGIPVLYGLDAIKGNSLTVGATVFPQPLAMACTWNGALVEDENTVTAYEMRATNMALNFGPNLDLGRHQAWSRLTETYGEDVFLAKTLGVRAVKGLEGPTNNIGDLFRVTTNIKHYVGYSFPVTGKDRTQAWIPENVMREYFLPTFAEALKAGAHTVILNSGEINGVPLHSSKYWITDVLRGELGFKGVVLSDWRDIEKLYYLHHIAPTYKEAVYIAINAGIDMNMVPYDNVFMDLLIELVSEKRISQDRIDQSVRRILKLKYELGLFDNSCRDPKQYPDFGGEKHRKVAKKAALESIVLLKNKNNILPLPKTVKVLVVGPAANTMQALNSGWTYSWQGNEADRFAGSSNTILEAIQQKIGVEKVVYTEGSSFDELKDLEKAKIAASGVDYIVLCLGEKPYAESPGYIEDLYLQDAQAELAKTMAATGKPVILVLSEGRPRLISKFEPQMAGIVLSFCPGNEGGDAFADVLFGDYNPNGRLCLTYPRYPNDLTTYDHKFSDLFDHTYSDNGYQPQYPFGYGLSYTSFAYSNLKLANDTISMNGKVEVSVEVENTGKVEGQEVVQVYIHDMVANLVPPLRRLRAFEKISLKPAEKKTVSLTVSIEELKYIGIDNKPTTEPGDFEVYVSNLKEKFYLKK